MKKYVLTNNKNEIIAISNKYENNEETRNIMLDDYAIAYAPDEVINAYQVEVPDEIEEQKYCYTEEDSFYKNENYVEPPLFDEQRLNNAENSITEIELALTEIYEGGLK
jgi:hypothetical protein